MAHSRSADLALLLARIPLGAYFMFAGFNKVVGVGVGMFASNNVQNLPEWLPAWIGKAYLHALPPVEFAVGAAMILGLFTRLQGLLMALMLASFVIAVGKPFNVVKLGGDGMGPPFDSNLVLLGLSLLLMCLGAGRLSLDTALTKRPVTPPPTK